MNVSRASSREAGERGAAPSPPVWHRWCPGSQHQCAPGTRGPGSGAAPCSGSLVLTIITPWWGSYTSPWAEAGSQRRKNPSGHLQGDGGAVSGRGRGPQHPPAGCGRVPCAASGSAPRLGTEGLAAWAVPCSLLRFLQKRAQICPSRARGNLCSDAWVCTEL